MIGISLDVMTCSKILCSSPVAHCFAKQQLIMPVNLVSIQMFIATKANPWSEKGIMSLNKSLFTFFSFFHQDIVTG